MAIRDQLDVFDDIETERRRQDVRWGEQNHRDLYWLGILTEELGEVAKAMIECRSSDAIRRETIQLAAVAVAFLECLDRREVQDD